MSTNSDQNFGAFIFVFVFVSGSAIFYICNPDRRNRPAPAPAATVAAAIVIAAAAAVEGNTQNDGVDAATVSTFPQYKFVEIQPHKSTADGCAVCLGMYKDGEIMRLLPGCGHVYHRNCIDPWLREHATCPLCRSSPLPPPQPAALVANQ